MNAANLEIRAAKPSDARDLNQFTRFIYSTSDHLITRPSEFRIGILKQRFWIAGKAANPFEICLIALCDGKIVGTLDSWTDRRARVSHVTTFAMSVAPDRRRQGIGNSLLGNFIDWVRDNPRLEKIELHVHADNAAALALYQQSGFMIEGTRERAVRYDNNRFVDDILMAYWPNSSNVEAYAKD